MARGYSLHSALTVEVLSYHQGDNIEALPSKPWIRGVVLLSL